MQETDIGSASLDNGDNSRKGARVVCCVCIVIFGSAVDLHGVFDFERHYAVELLFVDGSVRGSRVIVRCEIARERGHFSFITFYSSPSSFLLLHDRLNDTS